MAITDFLFGKDYSGEYAKLGKGLMASKMASQTALQRSLGAINRGYGNAQSALTAQGAVATKMLLDREQQALAGSKQDMISRGLYSTTAQDASARGVSMDASLALNELNAAFGQLHSNVKIQKAQDIASVYGAMSQNTTNYAQMALNLGLNTQYGQQGGFGNAILGILGMWLGGGFGAAAGAIGGGASTSKPVDNRMSVF
jgi:hypothetical protein